MTEQWQMGTVKVGFHCNFAIHVFIMAILSSRHEIVSDMQFSQYVSTVMTFMSLKTWANKFLRFCVMPWVCYLMCGLLQEDSVKTGKVTAAGMYFLGFPVYRFEQNNLVSLQDWLDLCCPNNSFLDLPLYKLQLHSGSCCEGLWWCILQKIG